MLQHELKPSSGSKKARKRVGRGNASGHGTFSGRGCKGQNSRSGGGVRPGFEGGQTPLYRRLPKLKGFNNKSRVEFQPINVSLLNHFEGQTLTVLDLINIDMISQGKPVKLLGNGDITVAVTIEVHQASKSAIEKVEKAGGKVIILERA